MCAVLTLLKSQLPDEVIQAIEDSGRKYVPYVQCVSIRPAMTDSPSRRDGTADEEEG